MAETGLNRAKEICQDRAVSARELKAGGRKIIGYLDIFPVLEMMTALDLVPYRLLGDINEPITRADTCLPTVVCPFLRSVMDLGLKGKYDFLDGVVMAHGCEVSEKTAHIWRIYLDPPYAHFLDTPHTTHPSARQQFKALLKGLGVKGGALVIVAGPNTSLRLAARNVPDIEVAVARDVIPGMGERTAWRMKES